jgi:hypothetical protein
MDFKAEDDDRDDYNLLGARTHVDLTNVVLGTKSGNICHCHCDCDVWDAMAAKCRRYNPQPHEPCQFCPEYGGHYCLCGRFVHGVVPYSGPWPCQCTCTMDAAQKARWVADLEKVDVGPLPDMRVTNTD